MQWRSIFLELLSVGDAKESPPPPPRCSMIPLFRQPTHVDLIAHAPRTCNGTRDTPTCQHGPWLAKWPDLILATRTHRNGSVFTENKSLLRVYRGEHPNLTHTFHPNRLSPPFLRNPNPQICSWEGMGGHGRAWEGMGGHGRA